MDLDGRAFTKRGNALVPSDVAADELMASLPAEGEVLIRVARPRSVIHHRWFFALLRLTIDATGKRDVWPTEENLLDALKLAVGHVDTVASIDGEIMLIPKSIAFGSMSQDEFARFVRRCAWVIFDHFGVDVEELMAEVDREQRTKLVQKLHLRQKRDVDAAA